MVAERFEEGQSYSLHRGTPMAIGNLSSARVTVAFSRGNSREVWKRRVVSDSWVENRDCDWRESMNGVGIPFSM